MRLPARLSGTGPTSLRQAKDTGARLGGFARLRSPGPRNGPQGLFEIFNFSLLAGGPYWI
jgi:hypothetical protein